MTAGTDQTVASGSAASAPADAGAAASAAAPLFDRAVEPLLAQRHIAVGDVRWAVLSGSVVDVGHWLSWGRLWVCVASNQLLLAAPGKRAFIESAPLNQLQQSTYNHVTGQIVLAPAPTLSVRTVQLQPLDAHQLLSLIRNEVSQHA